MVPRGPRCNASGIIHPVLYYCYLGISLENGHDAYLLGEEWRDPSTRFAWPSHNCTGKFAATRQIPGSQSSSTKHIHSSRTTIVRILLRLLLSCKLTLYSYFEMPHSFGYRARTRHMFKRGFKGVYLYIPSCTRHVKRDRDFYRTWSRQNCDLSDSLPCWRYCRHQSERITAKGHAPQVLPWVCPRYCQNSQASKVLYRRTGIVYNVTPHAVGVIVNKIVGNRYIEKRVNIRVEHIRHSKCRQEFLDRVKRNHDAHAEAKSKGGM